MYTISKLDCLTLSIYYSEFFVLYIVIKQVTNYDGNQFNTNNLFMQYQHLRMFRGKLMITKTAFKNDLKNN